jgi:hypothetical protein
MKSGINIFDFNLDRIFIPLIMIYFREYVVLATYILFLKFDYCVISCMRLLEVSDKMLILPKQPQLIQVIVL